MAEPWQWGISDIMRMISDRVQESLTLDYKASAALARESRATSDLSKDVSSFANSEGGTLIYGVTQDSENYPKALDVGVETATISAEWIGQIVDSRISPGIRGYRITRIDLSPGKALFIVHVAQSDTAHMADDNRYYRRSDCRSVPMDDYQVRDVMGRSKTSDFRLDLRLASGGTKLFVYGENFAPVPVPYYAAYIYLGEGSRASHPNLGAPVRCSVELQGPGTVMCDAFQLRSFESVPLMQGVEVDILQGTAISLVDLPAFLFFAWETLTPGRENRQAYHGTYDLGARAGQPVPLSSEKWSIQRSRANPVRGYG
jgi:hypothetical protein